VKGPLVRKDLWCEGASGAKGLLMRGTSGLIGLLVGTALLDLALVSLSEEAIDVRGLWFDRAFGVYCLAGFGVGLPG